MPRPKVMAIVGTRPEVIKMAPLVRALRGSDSPLDLELVTIEQQGALLQQALDEWELVPDRRLGAGDPRSGLSSILAASLPALERDITATAPQMVLVQGDTSTALAGALAATYAGAPVAHVEAGLRTGSLDSPRPEEMNRVVIDRLASVLYAPTEHARSNLLAEGVPTERIAVVGNTVVDAVQECLAREEAPEVSTEGLRRVLVTGHRREGFGEASRGLFEALADIARHYQDVEILFVTHPHPQAHELARELLGACPRTRLLPPRSYRQFLALLASAHVVVSDSGGIQEEAPLFGRPVLVTRDRTDRPEAIDAGVAWLVGRSRQRLASALRRLLDEPDTYREMARVTHPFGAAGATGRIVRDLEARLRRTRES